MKIKMGKSHGIAVLIFSLLLITTAIPKSIAAEEDTSNPLIDGFESIENWDYWTNAGNISIATNSNFVKEGKYSLELKSKFNALEEYHAFYIKTLDMDLSKFKGISFWSYVPDAKKDWKLKVTIKEQNGEGAGYRATKSLDQDGWVKTTFLFSDFEWQDWSKKDDNGHLDLDKPVSIWFSLTYSGKDSSGDFIIYLDDLRGIAQESVGVVQTPVSSVDASASLIEGFETKELTEKWKLGVKSGDKLDITPNHDSNFVKEGYSSLEIKSEFNTLRDYHSFSTETEDIDFSKYKGISFWSYVPEPKRNWQFSVTIIEQNGEGAAYRAATRSLRTSGWVKTTLMFSDFKWQDWSKKDTNGKLDVDEPVLFSFSLSYTGKDSSGNFVIYLDDFRGIPRELDTPVQTSTASSGHNAVSPELIYEKKIDDFENKLIYYEGELVASLEEPHESVINSKDGNYVVAGIGSDLVHFYDKTGNELWNYDFSGYEVYTVAISQNTDMIVAGLSSRNAIIGASIKALDKNGKMLWTYKTKDDIYHIVMSMDGNYILAGSGSVSQDKDEGKAYLLDKQGKLLWENDFKQPIRKVGISTKGDKIVLSDITNVFLYAIGLPIKSPPDSAVAESSSIDLEWGDVGADKYIIQIDNKTYETTGVKFSTPELSEGNHTWRVRAAYSDGYQGPWTKNRTITVPKVSENPVNITFQTVAIIVFVLLAIIFAIPYYKRAKLKREMAQTPTDWCPHCHKFTGSAKVCPHCGKETLVTQTYEISKKAKKK